MRRVDRGSGGRSSLARRRVCRFATIATAGVLWLGATAEAWAADWAQWRGPEQNGASGEMGLPTTWSKSGENVVWQAPYGGRSTPIAMGGRVYIINNAGSGVNEQERVMCFDADTGKVLWEHKFNIFHTDIPSSRVGWASLAGDPESGYVYAHGVQGMFLCLDRGGKVVWSHSLTEEYGRISGYGGRVATPFVDEDLVIVHSLNASWGDQARGGHRFAAFNKRTGELVWWSEPGARPLDTIYSNPVAATIKGQRLLVCGGADGSIHAMRIKTGEKVWTFQLSKRGINVSLVVDGQRVIACHSEENLDTTVMGRVVAIDATGKGDVTQTHEVWRAEGIEAGYASPALAGRRLYIPDNSASLHCVDADTGKQIWDHKYGTEAKGSPVWGDGKIYVTEVNARFVIIEAGQQAARTLSVEQFSRADNTLVEMRGSPAIANGRVYFTTQDEIYCIGRKEAVAAAAIGARKTASERGSGAANHLQVVPAEVAVAPGQPLQLQFRVFDAMGRYLGPAKVDKVAVTGLRGGVGESAPKKGAASGSFTPDSKLGGQAGLVMATMGTLKGTARVRVVPPLPFSDDFERVDEKKVPSWWIGAAGKFMVQSKDGSKVLVKPADNAALARADIYIGLPNLTGYTIEGDLMGTKKRRNMPDVGLIANRYTLALLGNTQRLRIVTWAPMPRLEKTIAFPWKPDQWYRMKLRVDVAGEKATVHGKVWPKAETEPAEWTIEVDDPTPNREGSPGLYGYSAGITASSPGTEIYYDNVSVRKNES